MTQELKITDQAAQRLIDSEGADQADERERTVGLEAQAFGMHLMILVCWLGALLLAVIGQLGTPIALILAPLAPALGTLWYSRRRAVDPSAVIARAALGRTLGWTAFYAVVLFSTIAALTHRAYYGEGIWHFTVTFDVVGDDLQRAMATFAVIGAGIGVLVSMAWMSLIVWRQRRRAQRDEVEALEFD